MPARDLSVPPLPGDRVAATITSSSAGPASCARWGRAGGDDLGRALPIAGVDLVDVDQMLEGLACGELVDARVEALEGAERVTS